MSPLAAITTQTCDRCLVRQATGPSRASQLSGASTTYCGGGTTFRAQLPSPMPVLAGTGGFDPSRSGRDTTPSFLIVASAVRRSPSLRAALESARASAMTSELRATSYSAPRPRAATRLCSRASSAPARSPVRRSPTPFTRCNRGIWAGTPPRPRAWASPSSATESAATTSPLNMRHSALRAVASSNFSCAPTSRDSAIDSSKMRSASLKRPCRAARRARLILR